MKLKKILKTIVLAMSVVVPLTAFASSVGVNDRDVMQRIVRSSMLPVEMGEPKETGTLLLSDSPEYAENDGILYGDFVKGDCRIYFYHVNQMKDTKKILVMAYNPTNRPVTVALTRLGYSRPSDAYYQVGKELSLLYYEGEPTVHRILVKPMSYAVVAERLNTLAVQPDQLVSAILDMKVPEQMQIASVIMPYNADPQAFMKKATYLGSDSVKLRGTFQGMDRTLKPLVSYDPADGVSYIQLADGNKDRFLKGQDVIDNRHSEDTGNYGLDYNIDLQTKGKGKIHLYFNPQGGAYAGVVELLYRDQKNVNQKLVEVPQAGTYSIGDSDVYAMQYIDSFDAGTHVNIHIMPPGAANLPVRLLLVPDERAQQIIARVNKANAELEKMWMEANNPAPTKKTGQNEKQTTKHNTDKKGKKLRTHGDTKQLEAAKESPRPAVQPARTTHEYTDNEGWSWGA